MRKTVAILVSVTATVFFALTAAGSLSEQSFGLTTVPASNACALLVTDVSARGRASGFVTGASIDATRLTTHERLRLMVPRHGDAMMLPTRFTPGGGVTMMTAMPTERHSSDTGYLRLGVLFLLMLLGIYVLWRGRDEASLGLGIFFAMMPAFFLSHAYAGLPDQAIVAVLFAATILNLAGYFGLYFMVDALAGHVLSPRARITARIGAVGALGAACAVLISTTCGRVFTGCPPLVNVQVVIACYGAVIALCFGILGLGINRTDRADRGRLRWIFWATVAGYSGPLLSFAAIAAGQPPPLRGALNLTFLAIPLGYTYAVLRHRVIDVGFVLNRALSLTVLTSAVVALFVLAESIIGHLAIDHLESMLIQLGFSVGLGMAFNTLHARLERWFERTLFRRRYEMEESLRALGDRVDHFSDESELLQEVPYALQAELGLAGCSIEPTADHAGGGVNRIVLPLRVQSRSYGSIVLTEDPRAESFASEELELLRAVAARVAAAISAIRAEKYEQLLKGRTS
jgi:hypothetical protein